jgi:hypothetical protein
MSRSRSRLAAGLAVVGFAVWGGSGSFALAEVPPALVAVELRHCERSLEVEVRRIAGVELRTTIVENTQATDAVDRVVATCRELVVDLLLVDAAGRIRLERTVALSDAAPSARARLVALAVAELVVARRQELETESAPKAPEPPEQARQPQEPPLRPSPPEKVRPALGQARAMAEAIGVVRAFPGSDIWLVGPGARGVFTLAQPFVLTLDLTAEWGKPSRQSGQVAVQAIGGALGVGWAIERNWLLLTPWVGARSGVVRLTGEPHLGTTLVGGRQSGPWLGPEMGLAAIFFPRAAVHATVALSAGAMLLGVRGTVAGDDDVAAQGPWAALVVGLGLAKP